MSLSNNLDWFYETQIYVNEIFLATADKNLFVVLFTRSRLRLSDASFDMEVTWVAFYKHFNGFIL